ncbi:MAG: hypothetical protein BGO14_01035 [Chlamydiales bacterium 38-26]|nr:hypothetical protein [Chlamydiales bacterium]OJV07304.1 MAG: hypothetical protein BGO14_01035 [Chlamydiales bacterium 38-26]
MTDIKSSTGANFHSAGYNYEVKSDSISNSKTTPSTEETKSSDISCISSTALQIKQLCDGLFVKEEQSSVDEFAENQRFIRAELANSAVNTKATFLDNYLIKDKNISLKDYLADFINPNTTSEEEFETAFRNKVSELNEQGLLTDLDGKTVKLTYEELEELFAQIDFKSLFKEYFQVEIEEDKNEQLNQGDQEKTIGSKGFQPEGVKTYKTSRYSPEDLKSGKNKVLLHILSSFNRAQLEMQRERSRIKKEQMQEQADDVKRLAIKLKEMRLEETHEEIVNYSINQTQLDQDQLKSQLIKVRSFLTPLQQFSRASGGLKLIQVEGDASSPLRARVVREFNMESALQRKSREVSLLHIAA